MEKTKKSFWSTERIVIAVMALAMVVVITMATTGAWFTDNNGVGVSDTKTFGTIVLDDSGIDSSSFVWTIGDDGNVLTPGDSMNVDFTVVNGGTADMYVRFRIVASNEAVLTMPSSDPAGWETDTAGDEWVYFGSLAALSALDDAAEGGTSTTDVVVTYGIPTTLVQDGSVEGSDVTFTLYIEVIQEANIAATAAAWKAVNPAAVV